MLVCLPIRTVPASMNGFSLWNAKAYIAAGVVYMLSGLSSEVCLSLNKVCRRGLPGLLPPLLLFTCHGAIGKLLNLSLPQFMTFVQMEFLIVLCLPTVLPPGLDKIDLCKVLKSIHVLRGDTSLLSLIAPCAIFKAEEGLAFLHSCRY